MKLSNYVVGQREKGPFLKLSLHVPLSNSFSFSTQERRRVFRWWCAFTFLLILVSTTIFVALTVVWRGEDISTTLAYFIMFPGHLLYRFVTLYFCLKYTRADFSSFVLWFQYFFWDVCMLSYGLALFMRGKL